MTLLLAFSDLTFHLEDTGISISGCPVSLDNKETQLGNSSDQESSPSSGKEIGVVLVLCRIKECIPPAISANVVIPEVPWCQLFRERSTRLRLQKL